MKHSRNRYQHWLIRKVPRANGFAWKFRFYCSDESGERKLKTQTFDALKYPTETAVRKAVEPQLGALNSDTLSGKINATMTTIIDRYYAEEFPSLRPSTQSTNRSLIDLHIRPKFGNVRPSDVSAILVKNWLEKNWLDKCEFGAAQKARARNILSRLLDLAMLWEYIPVQRNPMQLVKVKGSTKRQKKLVILTPDEFKTYVQSLPEPYNLMVLVSGCFGFRVSETLALKWVDFDFGEDTVQVRRVFTHSRIQELPKTDASADPLPIHPKLMAVLKHRAKGFVGMKHGVVEASGQELPQRAMLRFPQLYEGFTRPKSIARVLVHPPTIIGKSGARNRNDKSRQAILEVAFGRVLPRM